MSENGAIENIPGGVVRLSKVGVCYGLFIVEAVCVIEVTANPQLGVCIIGRL